MPPASGIRNVPPGFDMTRITPLGPQALAPSVPGNSQSVCGGPPVTSIFMYLLPREKPTNRLSGDQKGGYGPAPSVPCNGRATSESNARTYSRRVPSAATPANISLRPSGDTENAPPP